MKWEKQDLDPAVVRELSSRYGVDLLVGSILARRRVSEPEDVCFYLEDDLRYLHNPFLFVEMEDAVDRVLAARDEGEQVRIFGDRDVDGITSTVLLTQALTDLGLDVSYRLPMGDDPYGLSLAAVDEFAADGGGLLITVDCGTSNHGEIAHAAELGIETIVIDHHNPQEELPDSVALINPKVEDSGYAFRDLAGCGVVAKVVWALYFAQTPLYNQQICLLNVRPVNEAYVVDAVKMVNLVEMDRMTESIVPGMLDLQSTRLVQFLQEQVIFVYDKETQLKMLRRVFGADVDINVTDMAPEIWQAIPSTSGKSLVRMRELSKMARYNPRMLEELDLFISLFTSFIMAREEALSRKFQSCLDLVALGTLADLMPLVNENRILVKQGLRVLNGAVRDGVHEILLRKKLTGKRLDTLDIAWQVSPVINATGRMGEPNKAAELLLSPVQQERDELADAIIAMNKERKRLGEDVWNTVLPDAHNSFDELGGRFVVVANDKINRGITGIIAARLANYFSVPVAVVALLENKAVGSLRSAGGFDVREFLEGCSDLFMDYGGHDCAAGFSMEPGNYPRFRERAAELVDRLEFPGAVEEPLVIDAELPVSYMTPKLTQVVDLFEPYGEGNRPLIFLVRGVRIATIDVVGRKEPVHLRLLVDTGTTKWPAVYWNAAHRVGTDFNVGDRVDVVFRLGRNYFQNTETLQLTILDIGR
jgi:single-stranded-DNA-specific exonuclease